MAFNNHDSIDWLDTLSPGKIALRSASVMGIITACLTALAEIPLVTAVVRTMVAVVIFTLIGWVAGFIITSIDFESLLQGSPATAFTMLENAPDDFHEAVFEIPVNLAAQEEIMATPVVIPTIDTTDQSSRLLSAANEDETSQTMLVSAVPVTAAVAVETKPAKSRKMVVG